MEDIIIILLAFVWLMYSLYRGRSKKKQREKQTPQPVARPEAEKEDKDFETVFREILGEEDVATESTSEAETVEEETKAPQVSSEEEEQGEYERHTGLTGVSDDFKFSAEGKIDRIEDQIVKQKKQKEKHLEVLELWDEGDEPETLYFDPRTAVIHFEIMKRKY